MSLIVSVKCDGPGCRRRQQVQYSTEGRRGLRADPPSGWERWSDGSNHWCSERCWQAWRKHESKRRSRK